MTDAAEQTPAPSTYSAYAALPPLPLPALEVTAERYLKSVEPLLDEAGYAATKREVDALLAPGGLGRRLHAALEARAKEEDNWLAAWWDNVAYLDFPEPVLINSNFGISCDTRQPADDPILRAAEVAARTIDYYWLLVTETLPPETVGRGRIALDMTLMRRILGATREPGRTRDQITVYPPTAAKHLAVIRKNRIYTVEVLDAQGRSATVADLAAEFAAIVKDADAATDDAPPIAVLTTERRPVWAFERDRLRGVAANRQALARIETAIFAVTFDERAYDDFNATARAAIHGRPGERWMDKVFSYVVDASGRVSQHGEHSPADGMQFVSVFDYGCDKAERGVFRNRSEEKTLTRNAPRPERVAFDLGPETRAAIDAAAAHFEAKTADLDLEVMHFDAFGKAEIKTLGVGPDPFVQMGYQLAFTRLHGRTAKTYESAQTRMYKLGRTETIRSASSQSAAFTQAMDDDGVDAAARAKLLRAACSEHAERGKLASQGQGCDRPLLGLALMARELGLEAPALFSQEVWTRGWELSTAQLPMTALLVNGFGPVTHGGYGIGYVVQDPYFTCHVTSFRSHPETSSARFAEALRAGYLEMRDLLAQHPTASGA